ncbi:BnaCnng48390D [Brassica napus]|nr:unnamed protein product [Brassica napus]CDY65713.1 BnaCnng48390D [Brassica napus]
MVDDDGSGSDHDGRADHGEDEATRTDITWFWWLRINTGFVPLRRSLSHNGDAEDELNREDRLRISMFQIYNRNKEM